MAITREDIVEEIRKLAMVSNGVPPGQGQFESATGIKTGYWKGRFWARWGDALVEAGFEAKALNPKIPTEQVLDQLRLYVGELGRFPVQPEFAMRARGNKAFPSYDTFVANFGDMLGIAQALLTHSQEVGDSEVARICEERLAQGVFKPAAKAKAGAGSVQVRIGYVYLKYSPSLRLYKIGKTDNSEKRGHGLSLLLPEDLVERHKIKTDQPYILEKYWHGRFRHKKKQGEWFDLTTADIDAFKQRREFLFSEYFP